MMLEVSCVSDRGLVRSNNEDIAVVSRTYVRDTIFASVERIEPAVQLVIGVADGVGGSNAGEVASRLVLEQLTLGINTLEADLDVEQLESTIRSLCGDAHNAVLRKGVMVAGCEGMATTATVLFSYRGSWYLVHAGDSRFYHGGGDNLRQISRDHTLREFTGNPKIPGNILVNCYGSQDRFFVDFFRVCDGCTPGDVFLICSDGLSDMVDDETMWDLLRDNPDLSVAALDLLDSAKAAGGRDNITFVAARVL